MSDPFEKHDDIAGAGVYPPWVVSVGGMSRCRYCGAWVRWARTENGKSHPFNPDPIPGTGFMQTHYATCEKKPRAPRAARTAPKREAQPDLFG